MNKRTDGVGRGRIDRSKIQAKTHDEIQQEAAAERDALGLTGPYSTAHKVYNFPTPDIKQLREQLHCSQTDFAESFGLSLRTVQQWEQGRSVPDQPARVLLATIAADPEIVAKVVAHTIQHFRSGIPRHHTAVQSLRIIESIVDTSFASARLLLPLPPIRQDQQHPPQHLNQSVRHDRNEDEMFVA